MKIIQIKGANGSGKTTIAKQLIACGEHVLVRLTKQGKPYATILPDLGWIVIGHYDPASKMGGCDNMPNIASIKFAIRNCLALYPNYYGIVFEGMMISTIKSTFYEYLLGLEKKNGIEPLFVILDTTTDSCLKRISGRGTMKPNLKVENIASKVESIKRHALTYDQKYVRWIDVDKVKPYDMLSTFLIVIDEQV